MTACTPGPEIKDYQVMLSDHPALLWLRLLDDLVTKRAPDIDRIFTAGYIRERWLTGELFLSGFSTDGTELYPGAKADLRVPGVLVAELKMIGSTHQSKVLRGKAWSLQSDLYRLHRSMLPTQELHVGILVVKNEPPVQNPPRNEVGFDSLMNYAPPKDIPAKELRGFGPDHGAVRVRIWMVSPEPERYQPETTKA